MSLRTLQGNTRAALLKVFSGLDSVVVWRK
ncbi:hypothetical protein PITC_049960 [Penicillium italicum]|uniref:Uncharacterized protein n=1 Tax=Penicillium italicum TaxID=40296 RepID=A0A0A2K6Z6_PENIT|nr:hypothetical protein PITC_049960 [Penicillium italicum]